MRWNIFHETLKIFKFMLSLFGGWMCQIGHGQQVETPKTVPFVNTHYILTAVYGNGLLHHETDRVSLSADSGTLFVINVCGTIYLKDKGKVL